MQATEAVSTAPIEPSIASASSNSEGVSKQLIDSPASSTSAGLSETLSAPSQTDTTSTKFGEMAANDTTTEKSSSAFDWITEPLKEIQDTAENVFEKAFDAILDGTINGLKGSSDIAQGALDLFNGLKSNYEKTTGNLENLVDRIPDLLGGKLAEKAFDAATQPLDNLFASMDDSLGKKTLELIANPEALSPLLDMVDQSFEDLDNNPIEFLDNILVLNDIKGALFDPGRQEDRPYGEYSIIHSNGGKDLAGYLRDLLLPPLMSNNPEGIPEGTITDDIFMSDPKVLEDITAPGVSADAHQNEQWLFINGVSVNEDLARGNAMQLSDMFGRPVDVLQNPTDTIPYDVLESAVDKSDLSGSNSEPAAQATQYLLEQLKDESKDKVVVISHSQGSIITTAALENLKAMVEEGEANNDPNALTMEELSKLELYTFANPADNMISPVDENGNDVVYMEHFANEEDSVPHLGVLNGHDIDDVYDQSADNNNFSGKEFIKEGAKGHMLGEHYLYTMDSESELKEWGDLMTQSRLFSEYYNQPKDLAA